ncbi:MFS transporter [Phenylobacterium immobile]|uniref:MFS transporter n=1 Tax=Phenylobacterium immobile TaxID=21 RepID=UPI000ABE6BC3|nr:MFS transporter [Phenylobacterium immobile]
MSIDAGPLGPRPAIGWLTRNLYAMGSAANQIKAASLSMLLLLFYNQVVGLDPRVVSSAILITMFVDSFVDPTIGQISDNFRSRFGRRHPFMYFAAFPVSITFFLIWNPPMHWGQGGIFAWMLICLLILRAFDTFFELPSTALAPELATDYDERTKLLAKRQMFGSIGTLSVSVLVYQVFMRAGENGVGGVTDRQRYFGYSICAALLVFTIIIISSAGTHRQIPWLAKPPVRTEKFNFFANLREVFQTMRNRNFAIVALAGMVLAIGAGIRQSLEVYMGLFYWRLNQNQLTVLAIAMVLSGFVGIWLAPRMVKRFGKRVGALITGWTGITLTVAPIALDQFGLMPARHTELLFYVLVAFATCTQAFMIATGVKIQAMIADVVEDSAMQTGRRSEGLLFSADNLFKKAVSGVGVLMAGQMLHFVQFPENARKVGVSQEIANHLGIMVIAALLIFNGGCLIALSFYGITREKHEANLRELARMREEAAAAAAPAE